MSDFIIAPSASRDLNQISEYFLSRNLEAGEKLLEEFNKKCRYLVNFPHIGRPYDYRASPLRRPRRRRHWRDGFTSNLSAIV